MGVATMYSVDMLTKILRRFSDRQQFALLSLAILYVLQWVWLLSQALDALPGSDIPFHLLGGFFVGVFLIDVFRMALIAERGLWRDIAVIVGVTLIIGLFWEGYEYVLDALIGDFFAIRGVTSCCIGELGDTLKDLFMDGLGAAAALLVVRKRHRWSPMFW